MYRFFDKAVLHGGTAIWRCYNGNRFSEDIDVYLPKDAKKLDQVFENLQKQGFKIEKKKVTDNSLFSNLKSNNVNVRFEAIFKMSSGELKDYEKIDGNFITVRCLEAEELVKEKVNAYLSRLKIRDLYDIYFLLRFISDKNKVRKELERLLKEFKNPKDEDDLKTLILEGLVPKTNEMLNYIGKW